MKSQIIRIVLCIGMTLFLFASTAFAAAPKSEAQAEEGCTIRVSEPIANPGDTVTVELLIENNPGIQGAILRVEWDEGLTLTRKAETGEVFPSSVFSLTVPRETYLKSPYNLVWYAQDLMPQDIKDGAIATMEFKVSEEADIGSKLNIRVSCDPRNISDRNGDCVACSLNAGAVTVSDCPVRVYTEQVGQTVSVHVTAETAVSNTVIWVAEYSEQGRLIGFRQQTVDLREGDNTIALENAVSQNTCRTFFADGGQTPLCPAFTIHP